MFKFICNFFSTSWIKLLNVFSMIFFYLFVCRLDSKLWKRNLDFFLQISQTQSLHCTFSKNAYGNQNISLYDEKCP